MKSALVSIDVSMPERRIGLDRLPTTVGRGWHADVRLVDRCASRVHCEISEINGTLVVRDLKSKNGTSVNGQYVEEALLLPGDRLKVGISRFEVQYERRRPEQRMGVEDGVTANGLNMRAVTAATPKQSSPFDDDERSGELHSDTPSDAP
jgi:pSer/pThr/pTyr-binding forkhead associated (FHA) protein